MEMGKKDELDGILSFTCSQSHDNTWNHDVEWHNKPVWNASWKEARFRSRSKSMMFFSILNKAARLVRIEQQNIDTAIEYFANAVDTWRLAIPSSIAKNADGKKASQLKFKNKFSSSALVMAFFSARFPDADYVSFLSHIYFRSKMTV